VDMEHDIERGLCTEVNMLLFVVQSMYFMKVIFLIILMFSHVCTLRAIEIQEVLGGTKAMHDTNVCFNRCLSRFDPNDICPAPL
jgi:hypothetical protein